MARLNRSVPWQKNERGFYATKDSKHGVRRAGRGWETGIHQPYHTGNGTSHDDYDFHAPQTYKHLRDAQEAIEEQEADLPLSAVQDLPIHDRRGL